MVRHVIKYKAIFFFFPFPSLTITMTLSPPINIIQEYSLVWLNLGTLVLLPLFATFVQLRTTIERTTDASQNRIQDVCNAVNKIGAEVASAPQLMQEMSQKAIQKTIENLRRELITAVGTLQGIVTWLVNVYKATYRCLLGLAINGAVSAVTQIVGPLQHAAESVLGGIEQGASSIVHLFGGGDNNNTEVSLGNWTAVMEHVQEQVKNWTTDGDAFDRLIATPFIRLEQHINARLLNWDPFNETMTIASSQTVQYCDSAKMFDMMDQAKATLLQLTTVSIGLIVVAIVLCSILNWFYLRQRNIYLSRKTLHEAHDILAYIKIEGSKAESRIKRTMALVGHAHRKPIVCSVTQKIMSGSVPGSRSKHVRITVGWWLDFLTHPVAFYCLLLGGFGLLVVYGTKLCMERIMSSLFTDFNATSQSWLSDTAVNTTKAIALQTSQQLDQLNAWIADTETQLNTRAFGAIREASVAANETLTVVVDHISQFIKTTLGGTVLEQPATDVINCLILTKIENLEQGLDWIVRPGKGQRH